MLINQIKGSSSGLNLRFYWSKTI